ncbi:TPA: DUF551 domain-containing protein [Salmonella enterica subsp. enterica serovar Mississippi]
MTTITNSKLTDERVSNAMLIRLIQWADQHNSHYVAAALYELQERRKAESEPAGYHVIKECGKVGCSVATLEEAEKTRDFWNKKWTIRPYFYSAAPAPVVPDAISTRQAISKMEECEPCDSINVAYKYGWNACRDAMLNGDTFRENPISSTNNFREIAETSTNSPVIPEEIPNGLAGQIVSLLAHNIGDKFLAQKIWNACRAAMLQGSQPVSNHDELPVIGWLRSDYNSDDKRDSNAPLFMLGSNDPSDTWGVKYIPLSGNSPVIPDGWISCSERMLEDEQEVIVHNKLGYRYVSYFDEHSGLFFDMRGGNQMNCIEHILVTHWMPLPEPPLE